MRKKNRLHALTYIFAMSGLVVSVLARFVFLGNWVLLIVGLVLALAGAFCFIWWLILIKRHP